MKKIKSTKAFVIFILIILSLGVLVVFGIFDVNKGQDLSPKTILVSDEEIQLIKDLILDQDIIDSVKDANQEHSGITLEKIKELEKDWMESRKAGVKNELMENSMTNVVAQRLKKLQQDHPEFVEIFIADKYGLNVGQTNITSDYYQADEDWWVRAYNNGNGATIIGEIEYDESTGEEVVGIFFPVTYGSVNSAIGVIKALISVEFLNNQ